MFFLWKARARGQLGLECTARWGFWQGDLRIEMDLTIGGVFQPWGKRTLAKHTIANKSNIQLYVNKVL